MLQARQPQLALEAFRDLLASPLSPNVVTWAGVISGLTKESKKGMPFAHQAYQLWKELEGSGLQAGNVTAHAAGEAQLCPLCLGSSVKAVYMQDLVMPVGASSDMLTPKAVHAGCVGKRC